MHGEPSSIECVRTYLRRDVESQTWLYEVTGSSLGVTESWRGTSDHYHAERRLTIIDAALNALTRRLSVTIVPAAHGPPTVRGEQRRPARPPAVSRATLVPCTASYQSRGPHPPSKLQVKDLIVTGGEERVASACGRLLPHARAGSIHYSLLGFLR